MGSKGLTVVLGDTRIKNDAKETVTPQRASAFFFTHLEATFGTHFVLQQNLLHVTMVNVVDFT